MKPRLLSLHRWITLVFALPLAAVILTGLVLSLEPSFTAMGVKPASLTQDRLKGWLATHDPEGKARALTLHSYAGNLTISMPDDEEDVVLDLASGGEIEDEGSLVDTFSLMRRAHETLLIDLGWLVTATTVAMLALILLGLFMGWPRLRNTLAGWHKGMAWFGLPLVILSPLTGLMIALGISIGVSAPRPAAAPAMSLAAAVESVARSHDVSFLLSLRPRGGRMVARLYEGGEYRSYAVTGEGLTPLNRNLARLWHEGNWGGHVSALVNLVTSLLLAALLATGLTLWARRKLARRRMGGRGARSAGAAPVTGPAKG